MERVIVGPSDNHGGWWFRVFLATAKAEAVGVLFAGWGWDETSPLRPWPAFRVESRGGLQVLAWVVCCGFFLAMQTKPASAQLEGI